MPIHLTHKSQLAEKIITWTWKWRKQQFDFFGSAAESSGESDTVEYQTRYMALVPSKDGFTVQRMCKLWRKQNPFYSLWQTNGSKRVWICYHYTVNLAEIKLRQLSPAPIYLTYHLWVDVGKLTVITSVSTVCALKGEVKPFQQSL